MRQAAIKNRFLIFKRSYQVFLVGVASLLSTSVVRADYTWEGVPSGYGLTWSDEFNGSIGSAPNSNNWAYDTGDGGWGNSELENYTTSTANSQIVADANATDGKSLAIIAVDTMPGSGAYNTVGRYTSARLVSSMGGATPSQVFQYGYMEARVKMPYGDGIWPAFWMLGNDINSGISWPTCGEIDIMENIGNSSDQPVNHGSLHDGTDFTNTFTLTGGQLFHNEYHTFGAMWQPNQIQFYVDGNLYETVNSSQQSGTWEFNNNFFFLLNMAVGGSWPGSPDASTSFPQTMYVDYVRAYQSGQPTPVPTVQSTWRVRCGGDNYTDSQGNLWMADTNFTGGWPSNSTTNSISGALPSSADQTLYQWERYGNTTGGQTLTYTFNVPVGATYQVDLKFSENYWTAAGQRLFSYSINGVTEQSNFDIFATAGGQYKALDEVYNSITPNGSGQIIIQLSPGSADNPKIDAIQIVQVPNTPTRTQTSTVTATPTATSTNTPNPPTSTSTMTWTNTQTSTPPANTATSTFTETATQTPTNTQTSTPPAATATSTATVTMTPTPLLTTATSTPSTTNTDTAGSTDTATSTSTAGLDTDTPSSTSTFVFTFTSTSTLTPTTTFTNTPTTAATYSPITNGLCKRVLAYYAGWSSGTYGAAQVPYTKLTHICYAFITPNSDGSLNTSGLYNTTDGASLISNAHAKGVKVLISVGGASVSASTFSTLVASSTARANFVTQVYNFCTTYGFDGVDIDWEFPQSSADRANYDLLLQALRTQMPSPTYLISAAVSPTSYYAGFLDLGTMKNYMDFFNIMTYDYHGSWTNHSGHVAPLYEASGEAPFNHPDADGSDGVAYYESQSVPASQINYGLAFYGYSFNTSDIYQSCGGNCSTSTYTYATIASSFLPTWTYRWDNSADSPYLLNGTSTISYDDPRSIAIKANWALTNANLGGVFMWSLNDDYIGPGNQPLLDQMVAAAALCGSATPTPYYTTTPFPTDTLTITPTPWVASSYRVNAGGPTYVDPSGNTWVADSQYSGGTAASPISNNISNTTMQTLYQTERYGSPFSYIFKAPAGNYQVTLKFSENYWTGVGERVFNVSINGTTVLSNFDIFKDAGGQYIADDKIFNNIVSNGAITIQFGPASVDNAKVDAIQIITQPPTPTYTATQTNTSTVTPTRTQTMTPTVTLTNTPSSFTPTATASCTSTITATNTWTATLLSTATATVTSTPSFSTNCPGLPQWNSTSLNYIIGQVVAYDGEVYQCVSANVSSPSTPPSGDMAHWKDMGPCYNYLTGTPTSSLSGTKPVIGPNPVTSNQQSVNLWLNLNDGATVKVKIFTIAFREVREQDFHNVPSGQSVLTVDLHDRSGIMLSNGLYYVSVEDSGARSLIKLLILR